MKGSNFYFLLPLSNKQRLNTLSTDSATYYHGNYIDIIFNPDKDQLEADRKGFQNFESVKKGCLISLSLLKKTHCRKVLNDNTHVLGNWSEAVDRGGEVWFSAMEKAGLKYFSWIYSPSTFSQMSAQRSIDIMVGNKTSRFFIKKVRLSPGLKV